MTTASYPSLEDRAVVITGGASGIGAGMVRAFSAQGARVGLLDIADGEGKALADDLAQGSKHAPIYRSCDLTDTNALNLSMSDMLDRFGAVDVLVNNAASDDRHAIDEVTPDYWDARLNVNLRHQFFATKAVIPAMRAQRRGAIINMGSISWHLGLSDLVLYQTAKAAVEGLTRSLARELGRDGIRVNTILPGNVQTPRQERWYTPEGEAEIVAAQCLEGRIQPADVAALALFLAADDARMCTGHAYWVDAGWR